MGALRISTFKNFRLRFSRAKNLRLTLEHLQPRNLAGFQGRSPPGGVRTVPARSRFSCGAGQGWTSARGHALTPPLPSRPHVACASRHADWRMRMRGACLLWPLLSPPPHERTCDVHGGGAPRTAPATARHGACGMRMCMHVRCGHGMLGHADIFHMCAHELT